MHRTRLLALLLVPWLAPVLEAQRERRRNEPPPKLEHLTYEVKELDSKALGRKVPYGVYLPLDYAAKENAETRYPLVVWLHGMWENHDRFGARGGAAVLDKLVGDGRFPKAIFVTANGDRASFYVNGKETGKYEDLIVEDLLGAVTAAYRIDAAREQRAIMGISMGGYGALKIALRHPELFGIVATHSAAIFARDPKDLPPNFQRSLASDRGGISGIFGDPVDLELWRANNVFVLIDEADADTLKSLKIYFDCGDRDRLGFDVPNLALHELLNERRIPHEWRLIEGGGHGWDNAVQALDDSLLFVSAAWAAQRGAAGLGGLLGGDRPEGAAPRKEPLPAGAGKK
jgi:S-formylglutathione hydrolase FrmB